MIESIFTVDYEISGTGRGSLKEMVYEPARMLRETFSKRGAPLVVFVEVAELARMEAEGTDPAIDRVKQQIRDFHSDGCEIGLHIHPQWCNAHMEKGEWRLDHEEYSLCTLPRRRIGEIVDHSIAHLRKILEAPDFTPFSFRAGNWLFKPTRPAADVLVERGIRVDSSVFKGGVRHEHGLDYRAALKNGSYWKFSDRADVPEGKGCLLELPIYTQMVPFWRMFNSKRINRQHLGMNAERPLGGKLYRLLDFLRLRHPLKLDYCSMTIDELIRMVDPVIRADREDPGAFRPVVAIGHTKELAGTETVESFLHYLEDHRIRVSTLREAYGTCGFSA